MSGRREVWQRQRKMARVQEERGVMKLARATMLAETRMKLFSVLQTIFISYYRGQTPCSLPLPPNHIIAANTYQMNPPRNPFADSQPEDLDQQALEIMQVISKLAQSPSENLRHPNLSDGSAFSSRGFNDGANVRQLTDPNDSYNTNQRDNPIKIYSVVRKRVKLQSEAEENDLEDSQYIDSCSNMKITDYFSKKHDSLPMRAGFKREEPEHNPIVKKMQEKLEHKKKAISELRGKIEREKKRLSSQKALEAVRRADKIKILTTLLNQQYRQQIYHYTLSNLNKTPGQLKFYVKTKEELNKKLQVLREGLKKNKSKGDDSASYLEQYTDDHQDYMKEWKKKIEDERRAVTKEIERQTQSFVFVPAEEEYHGLPQFFLDQGNRIVFEGKYFPLYSRSHPESLRQGSYLEIRVLNLETLLEENMIILSYPKLMKIERRMKLKRHFENLFSLSGRLNEGRASRIFTASEFFGHPPESEMLLFSRACWDGVKPIVSLKELLGHYQSFGEPIAKYLIKVMLRAQLEGRTRLGHDIVILPKNIFLDQRNEIRIENWLLNETYRFQDFSDNLLIDSSYLYFPPEYQSLICIDEVPKPGTWTIGVILYEVLFGKKPFEYSPRLMDYEEFYMMNDVQFPDKSSVSEACKDFIRSCLKNPSMRLDLSEALRHPYFDCRK